jgi:hypothetical protein
LNSGVKVPEDLAVLFDEMIADTMTIQYKMANFSAAIHQEQKEVALKAKQLWAETMQRMGLTGEWRYVDGIAYPIDEPAD